MDNTIWTFGDSLTERFNRKDPDWSKYIDFKGYQPKVHGNFISEEMGYNLRNLGLGGADNYTIFQLFCDNIDKIKNNDIILFGWSDCSRFRMVDRENKWKTMLPNFDENHKNLEYVTKNTIEQVLVNRSNSKYVGEVSSWIKMINKVMSNNVVVHWTTFNENLNSYYFSLTETISMETNNKIIDSHLSENGQKDLSEFLMKIIRDKLDKKLI